MHEDAPRSPAREQSAFDVLLGKRKQPATPLSSALAAIQGALHRTGGSLSPATASPAIKRLQTPRGQSSYATCPLCSKSLPRALLDAHTSGCTGLHSGTAAAAQLALVAEEPSDAKPAPAQPEQPPREHGDDNTAKGRTAASLCTPEPAAHQAASGRPRQARLDGGAVLANRGFGAAGRAISAGNGGISCSQADVGCEAPPQQPPRAAVQQLGAADSLQAPVLHPDPPSGYTDNTTASEQAAPPTGNAFATMMQRSRQLAQVGDSQGMLPVHQIVDMAAAAAWACILQLAAITCRCSSSSWSAVAMVTGNGTGGLNRQAAQLTAAARAHPAGPPAAACGLPQHPLHLVCN